MSMHRSRLRARLSAVVAGALVAGGVVLAATPAQAAPVTTTGSGPTAVDDATFTWGISGYAQKGIFAPWTFSDLTGDTEVLAGSVSAGSQTDYVVQPVPATSMPVSSPQKTPNAIRFTDGIGAIDETTGAGKVKWDGSYTVNAYPAQFNAPDEIYSDPELTVNADGSGTLTAEFTIGAGQTMADPPVEFPAEDFGRLKIMTFDAGSLSNKTTTGYRVTPDYQGVINELDTQQTTCTTDGGATGWAGSWPTEFIEALNSHAAGQSVLPHFYSTSCGGMQDNKPPLPFDVTFTAEDAPSVTVSKTTIDPAGQTVVTVTGQNFNPALATGTRPPLSGIAAGSYIAFGKVAPVWRPSQGAGSATRGVITNNSSLTKWAVPSASLTTVGAAGVELSPSGSFTAQITVDKATLDAVATAETLTQYGIITYPGSGGVAPAYETLTPITFRSPATVSIDDDSYSGTFGTAIPVGVDVTGTVGTASGTVTLTVTPDGGSATEVDEATLVSGSATLEVPAGLGAIDGELSVSYDGDSAYDTAVSDEASLSIAQGSTALTVSGLAASSAFGGARTAVVTATGPVGTKPTGLVTAKIGTTTVGTGSFNGSGVASIALSRTIGVGNQTIALSYPGDVNYTAAEASKVIKVGKANVNTAVKVTKKSTTKKTGTATVTVTSRVSGAPKAYGPVRVYFKKSGSTTKYTTKTIVDGKGSITVPKLAKGTWKIYVKYYGTSRHNAAATAYKGSFKVTS